MAAWSEVLNRYARRAGLIPNLAAMMFAYRTKAGFTIEGESAIAVPPAVDFSKSRAPAKLDCGARTGVSSRPAYRFGDPVFISRHFALGTTLSCLVS
jgi:hypothetical protein